ncbi:MAG: mechanosensitive ion channel family protein [Drouetiella hepatica Uher 2000/2452]|jgi:small-conductance mechanosensitive channel|uniref:Mechanosensitive ion channel family protein n=1 Tax=Drouetiella hepatica Uher 2000/2452 TaxID=904376 RepID=A0A951QB88_9CYAN|nr:mechanosensitive ion channel family protein [Drouetiella hepatica Uher 2000/2452]
MANLVSSILKWYVQNGLILLVAIALIGFPAFAQEISPSGNQPSGNQIDGYPVMLNNQPIFWVRQGVADVVSAQERAKIIGDRLEQIASKNSVSVESITVDEQPDGSILKADKLTLLTIRDNDAKANNQSRQALAAEALRKIRSAIAQYREERSFKTLMINISLAALSTIALLLFLRGQHFIFGKLLSRIREAHKQDRLGLRVGTSRLLGSNATDYLLKTLIRLGKLALTLAAFYLYLPFILSQFPTTRAFSNQVFGDITYRTNQLAQSFVQYLPNLIAIVVIGFVTYYIIGFAKLAIIELGRGDAYPWFYPEWTRPTVRLVTFLIIAIACVVAGPYLPGFGSPVFQGVSLFLGALFTLGSSSAISNVVSGIILIYTRAFRVGDMIQIGDVTGEVIEKSLFVTRLINSKNVITTLPNAAVLNGSVINMSAALRQSENSLVLHTTITLGYDVPWRTVHQVLIEAAKATENILPEPRSFVLQTALNDFNVSYELNVHIDRPDIMPIIYSELYQNIQDHCNQAGIEILSPTYSALRDGNHSTIPTNYLSQNYSSPTFRINVQDSNSQESG